MIERERIEQLSDLLTRLEQDLDRSEATTGRRRRGVGLWVRIVTLIVAAMALSNLYFVNDLTDELRLVITRIEEMTELFDRVADRMDGMTRDVAEIEQNVLLMPVVSEQMREIGAHVSVMESSVSSMDRATIGINDKMVVIDGNMRDMSVRFRGLNRGVGAMGVDVDQMARPLP